MITEGRTFMAIARWVSLFPGLAVALTGIAFSVFGDGLADALRVRPR
jgi:peptide/nickel transport system permease protein